MAAAAAADRFTLRLPNDRRLHVFGGTRVRLGRTAESDLRVTVCMRGAAGTTKALIGEISRQHAEVFLADGEARVCDGWRSSGHRSTFGTYLETQEVPASPGTPLQTGQILRLTARPPSAAVAHWKIRVLTSADAAGAPASLLNAVGSGGALGVWLQRLDDLPDDVLLLAGACDLAQLGVTQEPLWLWRTGGGFLVVDSKDTPDPLERLTRAITGSTLDALGSVHPHDVRDALERASRS